MSIDQRQTIQHRNLFFFQTHGLFLACQGQEDIGNHIKNIKGFELTLNIRSRDTLEKCGVHDLLKHLNRFNTVEIYA